jgi:hypothetical protein
VVGLDPTIAGYDGDVPDGDSCHDFSLRMYQAMPAINSASGGNIDSAIDAPRPNWPPLIATSNA